MDKIFLIRHGQSEGNLDKNVYDTVPDYAVSLTAEGRNQAREAGKKLKDQLAGTLPIFMISPFWRTRETYELIAEYIPIHYSILNPHLVEQSWGDSPRTEVLKLENERLAYGTYFWKFPKGESCLDVELRVAQVQTQLETLHSKYRNNDPVVTPVLITHGMTMRLLAKRLLRYSIEEFEELRCPKNCEIWKFTSKDFITWETDNVFDKYESPCHPWQYKTLKERGLV